ncbi:MAG: hypothetical protein ACJAWV_001772 [Flammeovirgaceae bacterium]|jgi:hypothetical protein
MKAFVSTVRVVNRSLLILAIAFLISSNNSYEEDSFKKWSEWKSTTCYRYLKYRIKKMPTGAEWAIEFDNQYREKVNCHVKIINGRGHGKLALNPTHRIIQNGYYSDDEIISFNLENVIFGDKLSPPCDVK